MQTLQWPIIKYKQLRGSGNRQEGKDIRVVMEVNSRKLTVIHGVEPIETVYCNMEVSRYPSLKMKNTNLFVIVNNQAQGFRLTLRGEDRENFLSTVRKFAYISETPVKDHLNRSSTNTDVWYNSVEKRKGGSSSQPTSFSQPCDIDIGGSVKKSAARNLSHTYSTNIGESSRMPALTANEFFSQPVYNPYNRPASSASTVSSSIGSAYSVLHDDSPFSGFSPNSNHSLQFPCPSPSHSSSFSGFSQSSSHSSQLSSSPANAPSFPDFHSPPSANDIQIDQLNPVTVAPQIKQTADKCVQTDKQYVDERFDDPAFLRRYIKRVMSDSKMARLVGMMRSEIRKLPNDEFDAFYKKVKDHQRTAPSSSSKIGPPAIVQQTSDMEF